MVSARRVLTGVRWGWCVCKACVCVRVCLWCCSPQYLGVLDAGVEVLLVLADDDDVHDRVLGCHERVHRLARPHVGVETERLRGASE